jgi:hypothetical protein
MMTLLDIDPNLVKPGWTPLLILIGLALVMVLLFTSMRRQFRKIDLPTDAEAREQAAAVPPVPHD